MKRLLRYFLVLAFLFVILAMVLPLGLFAFKYSHPDNQTSTEAINRFYKELLNINNNGLALGSGLSILIFNLAAAGVIVAQQILWFKSNKKEHYPVSNKLISKYKIIGYISAALFLIEVCWISIAITVPIQTNDYKSACLTRIWAMGSGLIVVSILCLCTIGYSEWINLQILYEQQVKMVDEGIELGTHDPETRMSYEELEKLKQKNKDHLNTDIYNSSTNEQPTDDDIFIPENHSNKQQESNNDH